MRKSWLISVLTHLAICVVPMLLMSRVLFLDQDSHLANPGQLPKVSTITDLDGAARMAYLLSDMSAPWANTHYVSSPTGASVWRFQSATQGIQILFLWVMSQLVQPMLAANLLVLLGWISTGTATYLIARHFGCRRLVAVFCALAVQATPSMRFMAANFTSYINVSVPLFCLLAALKLTKVPRVRNFVWVISSLIIATFFDPYWLFFALFGIAIVFLIFSINQAVRQPTIHKVVLPIVVVSGYALCAVLARYLPTFISQGALARSIEVAKSADVRNSVLNWSHWSQSNYTGIGTLVLMLLAFSILFLLWNKTTGQLPLITLVTAFVLLASRITVPLTPIELTPALWIRQMMPGVRFFDRAALIAIPLIIILIARSLEETSFRFSRPKVSSVFVPLAMLALPFSYPNLQAPATTKSFQDWAQIRTELNSEPDSRVLALPFTRRGRDWIEQASFRTALVNDYVSPVMNQEVVLHASNGEAALAAFLTSIGVTHVFSIDEELRRFVDYELTSPRFTQVGKIKLNGFGEGPDYEMSVYRVTSQAQDQLCLNCEFGSHVVMEIQVSGDLVYPPEEMPSKEKRWWIGAKNSQIDISSLGQSVATRKEKNFLQLDFAIAPCLSQVRITIRQANYLKLFSLSSQSPEAKILIPITEDKVSNVQITSEGDPCRVNGDPRLLLVQLGNIQIK